ncbi:hypothetical protein BS78_08G091200 [Paspalum vaginatum]|nr:hypothetical protein BS78_08G091200 [Paspalum vaginatum]
MICGGLVEKARPRRRLAEFCRDAVDFRGRKKSSLISVDDKEWPEVRTINSYAIFMGYLLMGVRGLGLLISTWATVVLLGGFITMMPNKDFWCLSAITLIQIARYEGCLGRTGFWSFRCSGRLFNWKRVFDFLVKEKAIDVAECMKGLLVGVGAAVVRPFKKDRGMSGSKKDDIGKEAFSASMMLALLLCLVQLLVIVIALCPVALMYVFGLYTSAGISLWRLIKHDYSTKASEGAHLKAALSILYSLALAQGVVNGYRDMYYWVARPGLVKKVSDDYSLGKDLVSEYLEEIVTGCVKDPSFAKGRNLITYAVGLLMEPKSRCSYISGVMVLGTTLQPNKWTARQSGLIKLLVVRSTAFDHVVERLVETFGSTSSYSTEIRVCAARLWQMLLATSI